MFEVGDDLVEIRPRCFNGTHTGSHTDVLESLHPSLERTREGEKFSGTKGKQKDLETTAGLSLVWRAIVAINHEGLSVTARETLGRVFTVRRGR